MKDIHIATATRRIWQPEAADTTKLWSAGGLTLLTDLELLPGVQYKLQLGTPDVFRDQGNLSRLLQMVVKATMSNTPTNIRTQAFIVELASGYLAASAFDNVLLDDPDVSEPRRSIPYVTLSMRLRMFTSSGGGPIELTPGVGVTAPVVDYSKVSLVLTGCKR